jgi:hypothetical protein
MAYSSKLCNPTPFDVKLPWDRGVNIKIPAFGTADLNMQQMDDFRPGKPGTAAVKQVLDYHGLFLMDTDRPYDNQALDGLRRSRLAKKAQYDSATKNIRDRRAATGIAPNEEALEETLHQMGYVQLKQKIDILEKAVAEFQKVVGDQPERNQRYQLDPKRTVFVLDPPREFPSVAAMEFFLSQNPDIKASQEAFHAQASGESTAPSEPVSTVQQDLRAFVAESSRGTESL